MFPAATVRERGFPGSIDIWGGCLFGEGSYAGGISSRRAKILGERKFLGKDKILGKDRIFR
jgi:hypothetical protein